MVVLLTSVAMPDHHVVAMFDTLEPRPGVCGLQVLWLQASRVLSGWCLLKFAARVLISSRSWRKCGKNEIQYPGKASC